MIRYAVFPDRVISKADGDVHFITAEVLIKLYQVDPRECFIVDESVLTPGELRAALKRVKEDHLICLLPRYDGKYQLPYR